MCSTECALKCSAEATAKFNYTCKQNTVSLFCHTKRHPLKIREPIKHLDEMLPLKTQTKKIFPSTLSTILHSLIKQGFAELLLCAKSILDRTFLCV